MPRDVALARRICARGSAQVSACQLCGGFGWSYAGEFGDKRTCWLCEGDGGVDEQGRPLAEWHPLEEPYT